MSKHALRMPRGFALRRLGFVGLNPEREVVRLRIKLARVVAAGAAEPCDDRLPCPTVVCEGGPGFFRFCPSSAASRKRRWPHREKHPLRWGHAPVTITCCRAEKVSRFAKGARSFSASASATTADATGRATARSRKRYWLFPVRDRIYPRFEPVTLSRTILGKLVTTLEDFGVRPGVIARLLGRRR